MNILKEIAINHLSGLNKDALLAYIDSAWENMTEMQRRDVFGEINNQFMFESLTSKEHLEAIEIFFNDSIKKKYYEEFDMNSKNYTYIPEKTKIWFDIISGLLDRTCQWAFKGEKEIAMQSFKRLFELIKIMEHSGNIVFAHHYGDEMIFAKHDYQNVYKELQ